MAKRFTRNEPLGIGKKALLAAREQQILRPPRQMHRDMDILA